MIDLALPDESVGLHDLPFRHVDDGLIGLTVTHVRNLDVSALLGAGVPGLDLGPIERSKDFLLSGEVDYEFRTTAVRGLHTRESLVEAARWIEGAKEYFLQQYKDSGAVLNTEGLGAFSSEEMHALADAVRPIVPAVQVRGTD